MATVLYVQVWKNKITVKNIKNNQEHTCTSRIGFSSKRLLVGEFDPFVECLNEAFTATVKKSAFFPEQINVIIHPMEMNEDGLSGVEKRTLEEAAQSFSGVTKVYVYEESNNASVQQIVQYSGFTI